MKVWRTVATLLASELCMRIRRILKFVAVLWIRIRIRIWPVGSETFAGFGVGSGINHFGSGSGQPLSRMNLKQNFSDKIHYRYFSTKCKMKKNKNLFFSKIISLKGLSYKNIRIVTDIYECRRNFTNKVRVCHATLSRRRPALTGPKQDPYPDTDRS